MALLMCVYMYMRLQLESYQINVRGYADCGVVKLVKCSRATLIIAKSELSRV